jgi:hypothetical protein
MNTKKYTSAIRKTNTNTILGPSGSSAASEPGKDQPNPGGSSKYKYKYKYKYKKNNISGTSGF